MVFYTEEDTHGGTMLCATVADLTAQLRQTLWRQERPAVLTSATLSVGEDFRRFKEETGLLTDSRVTESVAPSPFDYRQNCLLYLPQIPLNCAPSSRQRNKIENHEKATKYSCRCCALPYSAGICQAARYWA